jgi:hypothetical protein
LGSHFAFWAGVPNFSIASASMRCELKIPVMAIHTLEICITSLA